MDRPAKPRQPMLRPVGAGRTSHVMPTQVGIHAFPGHPRAQKDVDGGPSPAMTWCAALVAMPAMTVTAGPAGDHPTMVKPPLTLNTCAVT